MAQWTIRRGRGWVMMKGRRVRPSLDRDAQLHFRVDAAAHLVGPGLCEGNLEFGSAICKACGQIPFKGVCPPADQLQVGEAGLAQYTTFCQLNTCGLRGSITRRNHSA